MPRWRVACRVGGGGILSRSSIAVALNSSITASDLRGLHIMRRIWWRRLSQSLLMKKGQCTSVYWTQPSGEQQPR